MALPVEERTRIQAPIEEVWAYLSDPPQVVPCLPGAELVRVVDERTYEGRVGVKVGQIGAHYRGTLTIEEMDAQTRTARMVARGDQEGAAGGAEARMSFSLEPLEDGATALTVRAELSITGRLAQMGGGMIEMVVRQLFRRFAGCVGEQVAARSA